MSSVDSSQGHADTGVVPLRHRWLLSWDPRLLLPAAVVANVSIASTSVSNPHQAAVLLMLVLVFAVVAGVHWPSLLRFLVPINGLLLLAIPLLALGGPSPWLPWAGQLWSLSGLEQGISWWLRGNAAVLILLILLATRPLAQVLAALSWWRCPRAMVTTAALAQRFAAVLSGEWQRIHTAARLRGWRPSSRLSSLRSMGWMLGALLLRAELRAQRVSLAMHLRGGDGGYPRLSWPPLRGDQVLLTLVWVVAAIIVGIWPWIPHL